jgi:hypothetical protein
MAEINHKLSAISSTYGMYSHITSQNYDGYELLEELYDIIESKAIFVASVMPVLQAGFNAITPDVASQIAAVMREFTDRGVIVWLRYGHEMNWYVDPVSSPQFSLLYELYLIHVLARLRNPDTTEHLLNLLHHLNVSPKLSQTIR